MKSLIVFTALVACSMGQVLYAGNFYAGGYAPSFAYNSITPGRTALDVFPYTNLAYFAGLPSIAQPTLVGAPVAEPADAAVVEVEDAPAPVLKAGEAEEDEAVIETAEPQEKPQLRPIFPIFTTDLRGGAAVVEFARPDQITPVESLEADEDFVVITPQTKSFPLSNSAISKTAIPAGIVQGTQPRFYSLSPFGQPILTA